MNFSFKQPKDLSDISATSLTDRTNFCHVNERQDKLPEKAVLLKLMRTSLDAENTIKIAL